MKKVSEHQEQCAIFEWRNMHLKKYPALNMMFSTLNGVRLNIGQAVKAKKSGNISGVPDIILLYPSCEYRGLFIELKVPGGKVSHSQKIWIANLARLGYFARVCYGSEEAIQLIKDYLRVAKPIELKPLK